MQFCRENYNMNYRYITDMDMGRQFLVTRVIGTQTGPKVHMIVLLSSEKELSLTYHC